MTDNNIRVTEDARPARGEAGVGAKVQTRARRCPWLPPEFRSPVGVKIRKDNPCETAKKASMKLDATLD